MLYLNSLQLSYIIRNGKDGPRSGHKWILYKELVFEQSKLHTVYMDISSTPGNNFRGRIILNVWFRFKEHMWESWNAIVTLPVYNFCLHIVTHTN